MNQPDINAPDTEHRLRDAIETINMFSDEPLTITQVVQPRRQATYTTRGLFESGCDILTCEPREGDTE